MASPIIDLHARLTKKYDYTDHELLLGLLRGMTIEDCLQLIRLCERDLSPETMTLIGMCHIYSTITPTNRPAEYAEAFQWFKKSVDLGNPEGMFHLAYCYRVGIGIPKDEDHSLIWFRRSAELGNPEAMVELANHHRTAKDNGRSFHWYAKSADLGNAEAMYGVAHCYEFGKGVEKNEDLALIWYQRQIDTDSTRGVSWDSGQGIHRILWRKKDTHALVRYYCQQAESCPDARKESYRHIIIRVLTSEKDGFDVIRRWHRLEAENERQATKITALQAEIETLQTELSYRPGGPGFQEAMADFVTRAQIHETDPQTDPDPTSGSEKIETSDPLTVS